MIVISGLQEDGGDSDKTDYANFKRIVWHESFRLIMESIMSKSKTGQWFRCGDGIEQHLFPFIVILSADYEEQ
jgi:hypothetical protein